MRGSLVQRYKGSWSIVVGAWPPRGFPTCGWRKASKITTLPLLLLPNGQRIGQRNENGRFNGTGGQQNGLGIPWHPVAWSPRQG
jgi:hypothetical protein